jgi:4-hydroxy-tetrahydrodipicolinate reductase
MTAVRIALVGAAGRMGLEIVRVAAAQKDAFIAAAVEYEQHPRMGHDIGLLAGVGALHVPISADLLAAAADCDVILDISAASATARIIDAAMAHRKPLVCGTTGISDDILRRFDDAARVVPVIHTKNFSVGIAVLASLVATASRILGSRYDVEIIEAHHRRKVDAPSGTAEILADAVAAGQNIAGERIYGRKGQTGERKAGDIGIHAVRGGGIFGDHTVVFAGDNERIEITHRVETRALLAEGAVRTALFIARATPGRYTMNDVLGI